MDACDMKTTLKSYEDFLGSLNLGEAESHENLTIFPIYTAMPQLNGYSLLDEAVKTGKFKVTEVSEGGSVPNLKVDNGLDADVLILDGDILVGAKQNRSVTTTIIIAKKTTTVVDVNCVEQGRWSYKSRSFSPSDRPVYASLRSIKARSVTGNLKKSRQYVADQCEVWDNVESKAFSFSMKDPSFKASRTGAADELYDTYSSRSKEYEKAFTPKEGQAGFIAVISGTVVGCDIFGNPGVLKRVYAKGLRSFILDAIEASFDQKKASPVKKGQEDDVKKFLAGIRKLKPKAFPSAGKGTNIRFAGRTANGFAVLDDDQVVHLAAFHDDRAKQKEHDDVIY